jgi:hypothetical protein
LIKYGPARIGGESCRAEAPFLIGLILDRLSRLIKNRNRHLLRLGRRAEGKPILIAGKEIHLNDRAFARSEGTGPVTIAQLEAVVGKGSGEIERDFPGVDFVVRFSGRKRRRER